MNSKSLILALLIFPVFGWSDLVKQSKSGICHDTNSSYYNRVKSFKPYDNLHECLSDGGRLPKVYKPNSDDSFTAKGSNIPKYSRSYFGNGWSDDDKDCINTRHELLIKQSSSTVDKGSNKCTANRGKWYDPYTDRTFYEARQVDIDHLVPLKWAWDHGAYHWTPEKRKRFANDESNLFAVQASVNREKGASGILEWLPPNRNFHCQYILRFNRVVKTYELVLSAGETTDFKKLQSEKCLR